MMRQLIIIILLLCSNSIMADPLEIAITFDDLPVHMDLPPGKTRLDVVHEVLVTLKKHHINNVYGFINAASINGDNNNYKVLTTWVHAGQLLANHTYDHIDLDTVNANEFIRDIKQNEPYLVKVMGNKDYHYLRYPFLHEGNTQDKRDDVRKYLHENGYKVAQVTMLFQDYAWNNPYARCIKKGDMGSIEWLKNSYILNAVNSITISHKLSMLAFHRDIKNILLLHIGAFDAIMLDELLTVFEKQGVKFISLEDAVQDNIYDINPNVIKDSSGTFLMQMLHAKKLTIPHDIKELLASIPEEKLDAICR